MNTQSPEDHIRTINQLSCVLSLKDGFITGCFSKDENDNFFDFSQETGVARQALVSKDFTVQICLEQVVLFNEEVFHYKKLIQKE